MDPAKTAEVKPAATLAERAAKVRQMQLSHVRTTLEQARDIGRELAAAKEQCVREGKPWLPWLQQAKVSRCTAARYIRINQHWSSLVDHVSLATHGGVMEAINSIAGQGADEQEIGQFQGNSAPAGLPCRPCRLRGKTAATPGCKSCEEFNASGNPPGAATEEKEAPAERDPGDDTETEAAAEAEYAAAPKDEAGHVLPPNLVPVFQTAGTFKEALSHAAALQKSIDAAAKAPGGEQLIHWTKGIGTEDRVSRRMEELEIIKRHLKGTKPYSICPWCKGKANKTCKGCSGAGWVTKTTWDGAEDAVKEAIA